MGIMPLKTGKNGYGVIAVISRSGQMSYLDDAELRERQETTGNDRVKFVMMQDGQVYGYWEDCYWEKRRSTGTNVAQGSGDSG